MKTLIAALTIAIGATFVSPVCVFAADKWIEKESTNDVATTADKFATAVEAAGAKVFARVDHAAGAKSIDAELEPTTLILFGNPKLGTPIMQANRKAGMDLPVRVLIWSEGGKTKMGALSPESFKQRYAIDGVEKSFEMMGGAINKFMDTAAK